jgi:hypothetical protein
MASRKEFDMMVAPQFQISISALIVVLSTIIITKFMTSLERKLTRDFVNASEIRDTSYSRGYIG